MSDAKLWIDEVCCTATITGANVSYTMPLWVFDVILDIIVTEAEKKAEVTHRDFDIQQELLDRYKVENVKLRELVKRYHQLVTGTDELWSWQSVYEQLRELGVEVD